MARTGGRVSMNVDAELAAGYGTRPPASVSCATQTALCAVSAVTFLPGRQNRVASLEDWR